MNVRQVVPRDAIPSVDDPTFVEDHDDPDDEVIVLEGDPPRAYPTRYLDYHEIVNDEVRGLEADRSDPDRTAGSPGDDADGGVPVAATWCPLCGSAVVYDRRVDGRVLEFGVSGKLADDDLVMYDRETDSEWKQSTGRAIAGSLEGERLTVLPASVTTYRAFREEYPDGVVLAPPGGNSEASGAGEDPEPIDYDERPYRDYFRGEGFGLAAHRGEGSREWDRDDIDPKSVVLGIERGDDALGFPMERVEAAGGVVHAEVGGEEVVVFVTDDGVFAYGNPGFEFRPGDGSFLADGTTWDGTTGESADGRRLPRVPARRLFAFAWQDDHGPDAFFE